MVTGPQLYSADCKLKNLRLANWLLAGAVAIALISILLGLLQNRKLGVEKKQLQFQLQRLADTQPCDSPRLGDVVPPIEADTSDGKRVTVHYTGTSKYLLFFLSFKCNECVRELPNWNEIAKRATAKNVRVLGLATDKEVVNTNAPYPGFNIVTTYDAPLLRAYRINITPTVMLISEHGRTQWVHSGSLSEANTQELLSLIDGNIVIE